MAPLLELRNIGKRFGRVEALVDVSLHVEAGEVLGLLGDNRAGKSTLIKVMSGVHRPDRGELRTVEAPNPLWPVPGVGLGWAEAIIAIALPRVDTDRRRRSGARGASRPVAT